MALCAGSAGADAGLASARGGMGGGSSGSNSSSRRGSGDKPHVPIWERSQPNTAAESRRAAAAAAAAAAPKVMQPVALKTFSPTLGSLGPALTAGEGCMYGQAAQQPAATVSH